MALLFIDGFDHYATADLGKKWTFVFGSSSIDATRGRRGTGAFASLNGGNMRKVIPASSKLIAGFAWYPTNAVENATSTFCIITFWDGGTEQIGIYPTADGGFGILRFASGSPVILGKSAGGVFQLSAWNYVEVKATFHDTAGAVEVRCNGVTILTLANVDTRNGASGAANQVKIGAESGTNIWSYYDDFYVCDATGTMNNDFLGDVRVESLYPNADGTYSQFVPSTGTAHYALVDEATPNTTDYNIGMNVGDKDTYALGSLVPIASEIIYGVQVNAALAKDDAGSKAAATMIRSGAADATAAPFALTITQKYASNVYETDPNGGAAWTASAVNALEAGVIVMT